MKSENYIQNATSPAEHLSNVVFQAANVNGWIGCAQTENAHVKAACLLRDAEALVASLASEIEKEENHEPHRS